MIQANEFRIGNKVNFQNYKDCFVSCIDKKNIKLNNNKTNLSVDDISAIPLTIELLEKFGFEVERLHGNSGIYNVARKQPLTYNSIHGWWVHGVQMEFQPKSLHQLQNLFFALTGKELEVNL